jgi:hypothetical protein
MGAQWDLSKQNFWSAREPTRIAYWLERPLNNGLTTSHKLESMLPMFKNYPTYALKEVMLFGGQ